MISKLRIAQVNYAFAGKFCSPEELLNSYETLTGIGQGLAALGTESVLFQRFHQDAEVVDGGARYCFFKDSFPDLPRPLQIPKRLHRSLIDWQPHIVHLNGLIFPLQTAHLHRGLALDTALLVQNHGERPMRGWKRRVQRWAFSPVDRFLFTAASQAAPWLEAGVIRSRAAVSDVMEGSTVFRGKPRQEARQRLGIEGNPVFLWVGNLNPNKDPLTALRGLQPIFERHPEARLHMIYRSVDLEQQVRAWIAGSSVLRGRVRLEGERPHAELEWWFSGADYFVLASHREGSGYSLAEALACGTVPLVSDIDSFRRMTDDGRIGRLFPSGDSLAMARAGLELMSLPRAELSLAARKFFESRLSFPAIAARLLEIYREVLAERQAKGSHRTGLGSSGIGPRRN